MRKTYVLVHGAYHGGWCWKEVAQRLRAQGHDVYTPTMTGLGERAHLISVQPSLKTFIEDVAQVIKYEDLSNIVLVGHSFAGAIISALADRMPEKFTHLVYLDAQVLEAGRSPADMAAEGLMDVYRERAKPSGFASVPCPPVENFGIVEPAMVEWVRERVTPHPYQTYFDPLELKHPLGNGVPATYVAVTPLFPNTVHSRKVAREQPGWAYVEMEAGHDAMLTNPAEVTALLLGLT